MLRSKKFAVIFGVFGCVASFILLKPVRIVHCPGILLALPRTNYLSIDRSKSLYFSYFCSFSFCLRLRCWPYMAVRSCVHEYITPACLHDQNICNDVSCGSHFDAIFTHTSSFHLYSSHRKPLLCSVGNLFGMLSCKILITMALIYNG